MTTETFVPTPVQVVNGTGPYQITHPYDAGSITCGVTQGEGEIQPLPAQDVYAIVPAASDSGGFLLLTVEAAQAYDGWDLYIERSTPVEQGWAGQSARETGLEAQLDVLARAVQDIQLRLARVVSGFAVPGTVGDMLGKNNLSDLSSVAAALETLGVPTLIADAINAHSGTEKGWVSVLATKTAGTTYTNTGDSIVKVIVQGSEEGPRIEYDNGGGWVELGSFLALGTNNISFDWYPGESYRLTDTLGITHWLERNG